MISWGVWNNSARAWNACRFPNPVILAALELSLRDDTTRLVDLLHFDVRAVVDRRGVVRLQGSNHALQSNNEHPEYQAVASAANLSVCQVIDYLESRRLRTCSLLTSSVQTIRIKFHVGTRNEPTNAFVQTQLDLESVSKLKVQLDLDLDLRELDSVYTCGLKALICGDLTIRPTMLLYL